MSDLPYRPAVGIMLIDAGARVFVGQRIDTAVEAWQMPQGGIDPGEEALAAALRELGEETGVPADKVELVARAPDELFYDLPPELAGTVWKGRYRGQRQRWFLFRLTGSDADVDITTPEPEFRAWRWADPGELDAMAVPFKRELYARVLAAFATHL